MAKQNIRKQAWAHSGNTKRVLKTEIKKSKVGIMGRGGC